MADYILKQDGYGTRLIRVEMVGKNMGHAENLLCHREHGLHLDYNDARKYFFKLKRSGKRLRQIATDVADSFDANWTFASEFTYTYKGRCEARRDDRGEDRSPDTDPDSGSPRASPSQDHSVSPPAPKDRTIKRVLVFFLLIIAIVVGVAVASIRNINRSVAGNDWVNHTHSVILEAEELISAMNLADGAAHTFVVTGDPRDRASVREALSDASEDLDLISALTRNEPGQKEEVTPDQAPLVNQRSAFIRQVLAARLSEEKGSVQAMLADDVGQTGLKEIQHAIERLKNDELGLLTDRDNVSFLQAQTTRWTVWTGVGVDFLLLAGAGWLIADDITARRNAAAALLTSNEQLEVKVAERTVQLASANERLTEENLERSWANQGLEHQLHYSQIIFNSINDLVLVLTKATNISRVNPAVVRLSGLEPHELIHRPFATFATGADAGPSPMLDPIALAMAEGRDLRDHPSLVTDKLGRKIPVRLALFPLRDRDKVVGGIVILQVLRPPGSHE